MQHPVILVVLRGMGAEAFLKGSMAAGTLPVTRTGQQNVHGLLGICADSVGVVLSAFFDDSDFAAEQIMAAPSLELGRKGLPMQRFTTPVGIIIIGLVAAGCSSDGGGDDGPPILGAGGGVAPGPGGPPPGPGGPPPRPKGPAGPRFPSRSRSFISACVGQSKGFRVARVNSGGMRVQRITSEQAAYMEVLAMYHCQRVHRQWGARGNCLADTNACIRRGAVLFLLVYAPCDARAEGRQALPAALPRLPRGPRPRHAAAARPKTMTSPSA